MEVQKMSRKIPMKKRETEAQRSVSFTKRRQGLFSKACALCSQCKCQIAIMVSSPCKSRNVFYSFGHASIDALIQAFLTNTTPQPVNPTLLESLPDCQNSNNLHAKKQRDPRFWWEVDDVFKSESAEELRFLRGRLHHVKNNVISKLRNKRKKKNIGESGNPQFVSEFVAADPNPPILEPFRSPNASKKHNLQGVPLYGNCMLDHSNFSNFNFQDHGIYNQHHNGNAAQQLMNSAQNFIHARQEPMDSAENFIHAPQEPMNSTGPTHCPQELMNSANFYHWGQLPELQNVDMVVPNHRLYMNSYENLNEAGTSSNKLQEITMFANEFGSVSQSNEETPTLANQFCSVNQLDEVTPILANQFGFVNQLDEEANEFGSVEQLNANGYGCNLNSNIIQNNSWQSFCNFVDSL